MRPPRPTTNRPGITRLRAAAAGTQPGLPPTVNSDLSLQHPRCVFQLFKTAIFALYARDGRAHHRHTERRVPESRGAIHFRPQRRRHEKGRHYHVRGWLDAAYLWNADHPDRGHAAIAAGQRGTRGRRRERPAGPLQYPGRHRYGRRVRHLARLSKSAHAGRYHPESLSGSHHAHGFQAGRMGVVQLLVEHAALRRLLPESHVWRRGHQGKRLRIPLHAEGGSQLLLDRALGPDVPRLRERIVCVRYERRGYRSRFAEEYRRL